MRLLTTALVGVVALLLVATPVARAEDTETLRGLLGEIRQRLEAEKAKERPDRDEIAWLEGLLDKYKPGAGPSGDWNARDDREIVGRAREAIDGALSDIELSDEERDGTMLILTDWYVSRRVIQAAKDRASASEIDSDRDNRLKRLLGQKRAVSVSEKANRAARWMFRNWDDWSRR